MPLAVIMESLRGNKYAAGSVRCPMLQIIMTGIYNPVGLEQNPESPR
jgi:hypothetical protein